jgi:hypothetical protein
MTSKIAKLFGLPLIAAGAALAMAGPLWAQESAAIASPETTVEQTEAPPSPEDSKVDWSQLDVDGFTLAREAAVQNSRAAQTEASAAPVWSSHDNADGSAAVSIKQSVLPLWDTRIGADMNVVRQPSPLTASDLAADKLGIDGRPTQSSGSAYAAMSAPGLGSIWDTTAVEARVDPTQDQSKFDTSLSKAVPLGGSQYALTVQNGYNIIQQSSLPSFGLAGHLTRSYETDQSAKLNVADTGTSLTAGQSLSSADDKWLRRIGAEQKLFDGVSINGSISETPFGPLNRSLTAAFKRSW